MYQRISKILLVIAVSVGLLACVTVDKMERQQEQQLVNAGASPLSRDQVIAYLSGKTQQWENGGAYFLPDGTVYVKFAGKVYPERTWVADDSGRVCVKFPDGSNSSCSRYFDRNGKIWVITLEIFGEKLSGVRSFRVRQDGSIDPTDKSISGGPDTVLEGNRLSEM
jgi:hypothetical protein